MQFDTGSKSSNPYQSPQTRPDDLTELGAHGPPWEAAGPSAGSFWATAKAFYSSMPRFFRTLRLSGGVGRPLLYLLIAHCIGDCVYMAQFLAVMAGPIPVPGLPPGSIPWKFLIPIALIAFVVSLLAAVLVSFLASAAYHATLRMLRGNKQGFVATYRVVAYSHAHGFLLYVIPCCGYYVGVIAALILTIIGLAIVHEISGWRAAGAVLSPILAGCLLAAGIVALVSTG